jgi:hypothetical protein
MFCGERDAEGMAIGWDGFEWRPNVDGPGW